MLRDTTTRDAGNSKCGHWRLAGHGQTAVATSGSWPSTKQEAVATALPTRLLPPETGMHQTAHLLAVNLGKLCTTRGMSQAGAQSQSRPSRRP